jgi:hypothetical protein
MLTAVARQLPGFAAKHANPVVVNQPLLTRKAVHASQLPSHLPAGNAGALGAGIGIVADQTLAACSIVKTSAKSITHIRRAAISIFLRAAGQAHARAQPTFSAGGKLGVTASARITTVDPFGGIKEKSIVAFERKSGEIAVAAGLSGSSARLAFGRVDVAAKSFMTVLRVNFAVRRAAAISDGIAFLNTNYAALDDNNKNSSKNYGDRT